MVAKRNWRKRLLRHVSSSRSFSGEQGFLLPVVIVLSVAISIVSVVAMKGIAENSTTLNNQYYDSLAREAAKAGTEAAAACIRSGTATWDDASSPARPLTPLTDCAGNPGIQKVSYVAKNDNWTSTYRVKRIESVGSNHSVITSIGSVNFLRNGVVIPSQEKIATVRTYAQTSSAATAKNATALSTGPIHACAVAGGGAFCWGNNDAGQLGTGTTVSANEPTSIALNPSTIPAVAAICTGGYNWFGNCNSGFTPAKPAIPASLLVGKTITKISSGSNHTCAVANDKAYCWGSNNAGQLGNRTNTSSNVPVAVDVNAFVPAVTGVCGATNWLGQCTSWTVVAQAARPESGLYNKKVTDIQAGNGYTCALTEDSLVSCWGTNAYGQLGVGDRTNRNFPVQVSMATSAPTSALAGKKVKKIGKMTNSEHTCVITDETARLPVCWGRNYSGQVGNDVIAPMDTNITSTPGAADPAISTARDALRPTNVYRGDVTTTSGWFGSSTRPASGLKDKGVLDVRTESVNMNNGASTSFTMALGTDGRVYYWGGSTSTTGAVDVNCWDPDSPYSCQSFNYRDYSAVSRPYGPMYGRDINKCWGRLTVLTRCDTTGTLLDDKAMTLITGNVDSGIFCGFATGTLYCDGPAMRLSVYKGQLGDGVTTIGGSASYYSPNRPSAVTATGWLSGKTITDLQTSIPGNAYMANAAPGAYTCAIASEQIGCWGNNLYGQLGDGTNTHRNAPTSVKIDGALSGGGTSMPVFNNPIYF